VSRGNRHPAAKPPVREADQWRGFGGTGRFPRNGERSLALFDIRQLETDDGD